MRHTRPTGLRARFHDPNNEWVEHPSAGCWFAGSFQVGEFAEDLESGVDFFAGERLQSFGSKTLDRERAHHTTIKQSALQNFAVQLFLRSDVSHESTGERIAGAGGIFHFLDRQSGCAKGMASNTECALPEENGCAVFTMLDDQSLRSHGQDFLTGSQQVWFTRKALGLRIVY